MKDKCSVCSTYVCDIDGLKCPYIDEIMIEMLEIGGYVVIKKGDFR